MSPQHNPAVTASEAELPCVLSLDVGSSSVRALVFDRLGRPVHPLAAQRPYSLRTGTDGTAEANAEALFDMVGACLDEVTALAATVGISPAAVAVCTLVSNVLGVDRNGHPITPVYTYADTRPAAEVEWLRRHLDEREAHRRTGCRFHTSYLPARFLWLKRTRPDVLRQAHRWISFGEYLELRLFGQTAVSYSVASWTGLLDRHHLCWDQELLSFLPISEAHLSPLTDVSCPRVGLPAPFAGRWPTLKDVPWFPAIGDGAAANVGSGCVVPERVALTVGTTSAVRAVVPSTLPDVPLSLWCYRVDARRSLPGGALSEGGNVLAWLRATLQGMDKTDLNAALAAQEPDAHGLTVLPFLAGERSPGWHENARGTVHGLTLGHTPLDLLRAGLEAVAYRMAAVFDELRPLLPAEPSIVASGGALQHVRVWPQIIADVLGRPLALSAVEETSARGAALLALEALGVIADLAQTPVPVAHVYEPNLAHHARYQAARERQEHLYRLLVDRTFGR